MARRNRNPFAAFGVRTGARMGGSNWGPMNNRARKRRRKIIPLLWNQGNNLANNLNLGFGGRSRGPGSMTTTRIKNVKMDVSVKPVGTGSSYSYFKSALRPSKGSRILKNSQAPYYAVFNDGSRLESTQGLQAFTTNLAYTAGELHALYQNVSSAADGSAWMDWCRVRTVFQNQSEATTFLTIYEIATRRDSVQGPVGAFTNGIASIQKSANDTAVDIGCTPFMSPRFTENYVILKKYNVELAQGRSHIHTSMYRMHKRYSDSRYQMDSSDFVLGGWTRGLFVMSWGTPYNSATDKTKVSTTPVALDIVNNRTYCLHASLINKAIFEVESDFQTFADGQILDIGSGEPDALGSA